MFNIRYLVVSIIVVGLVWLVSCKADGYQGHGPSNEFKAKWYGGKAEITSYTLQQARYGEIREGEAVLIFVTEDLHPKTHVKLDDPAKASDKVSVMKLNFTKKFQTGIYPYSMMASVFTPVSANKSLKLTGSIQEWCGQVFTQFNLAGKKYKANQYSYFESEGDKSFDVSPDYLEDELWNMIRLNPEKLPVGKHKLLPSVFYSRLKHKELKPVEAELTLDRLGTLSKYTINYPEHQRKLSIYFNTIFPYTIERWEEEYRDGKGSDAPILATRAERKKRIDLDYWKFNQEKDRAMRDSLELLY